MAQNQTSKNSQGVCKKIRNAVSECPVKATIRRISHQPQASISSSNITHESSPKLPQIKIPSPNKPVHIIHQSSLNKSIPIEFEPPISHFSSQKPNKYPLRGFDKREIVIASGQENGQKASKKVENDHVPITAKAKTKKDDDDFSDYISKVKRRMIKTMTNVGVGGGGGRNSATRRDSFNDKVMDYINHAKTKIRTTTITGNQKSASFK